VERFFERLIRVRLVDGDLHVVVEAADRDRPEHRRLVVGADFDQVPAERGQLVQGGDVGPRVGGAAGRVVGGRGLRYVLPGVAMFAHRDSKALDGVTAPAGAAVVQRQ